ncbi:vitelline membrane outer layer 1 homolog a [Danio aesculapii]|uniref:vitelline membrane outer layer 1 homolog a n=1 Tax=Danio aesculapii TaxID=1142201 RepID=UPI0024BF3DAF|nr:vitelline membrane outer layer 1 homolog a [Danio aesculapii]
MHRLFSMILLLSIIGLHVVIPFPTDSSLWIVEKSIEMAVDNGGEWGSWGPADMCPWGSYARGFSLKVEEPSHFTLDETSVNGIRLYCVSPDNISKVVAEVQSKVSNWGEWTSVKWCRSGFLKAFKLRVESPQGFEDDTAATNIMIRCSDGSELYGYGMAWGDWGSWSKTCLGKGICGIKTRVEEPQGIWDDTALNDAVMYCCD